MSDDAFDYEFEGVLKFDKSYSSLSAELVTQDYAEIVTAFKESMHNVFHAASLPLQLIYFSAVQETCGCIARHRLGLTPDDASKDSTDEFRDLCNELVGKHHRATKGVYSWEHGAHNLKHLLIRTPVFAVGIEAILAALLTTAYANFETLAGDLWVAAVNAYPALAKNFFEKNSEKQLSGAVLAGYGFDCSKIMGRILHDTCKVSFDSLNNIQNAYSHAFKKELDEAFEPRLAIYHAEKVRHLIAHRAGIVDTKFLDQMKDFGLYLDAEAGDRIKLTGPIVGQHINACIVCGINLVRGVDQWSAAN